MLNPIESCRRFYSFFKIADQTTDQIPGVRPPDFNVALFIDSYDRVAFDTGRLKCTFGQLILVNDLSQCLARHLYEIHCNNPEEKVYIINRWTVSISLTGNAVASDGGLFATPLFWTVDRGRIRRASRFFQPTVVRLAGHPSSQQMQLLDRPRFCRDLFSLH